MNKKNILFTIILFATFLITSTLALLTAKKATSIHVNSANNPDFFMNNAVYSKFNHDGHINNQIHTTKITHFAANNTYLFDNPHITIYNNNEPPWQITANKGKSEEGKSIVHLWDNVKIIRTQSTNSPDFDITTNALTIYPDTKFAETKQPITIIQSGNTTKSVGAEADFKTGIVRLLSKIEAIYQIK